MSHFIRIARFSKRFEPRSTSSSYSVIVQVRVVLKRTAVDNWRFDNLSESHLQSIYQQFFYYPHPDDHIIGTTNRLLPN